MSTASRPQRVEDEQFFAAAFSTHSLQAGRPRSQQSLVPFTRKSQN